MSEYIVLGPEDFQENTWCPGCKSTASSPLSVGPYQFPHEQRFPKAMVRVADEIWQRRTLMCCDRCGLWYISPVPRPKTVESLHEVPEYGQFLKQNPCRKTFDRAYHTLRSLGTSTGRILDIGAHTGEFLHGLPSWDRYALEPIGISRQYLDFATEVYSGYIDYTDSLPAEHFDVVSMFDIAEHLYDVRAAFDNIGRCLKPGGILVLETGSTDSRIAQRQKAWWYYVHWYGHFVFHSRRSMEFNLSRANLEIVSYSPVHHCTPSITDVGSAVMKLVGYQAVTIGGTRPQNWSQLASRLKKAGTIPSMPWRDHVFLVARKRA